MSLITQRELASLAGVSSATVSLALRNSPEVSLAMCRRIQALAKRHGYAPNASATSLAAARWAGRGEPYRGVLAFVSGDPGSSGGWKSWATHRKMFEGAVERAQATGYQIQEYWWHDPEMAGARLSRVLAARGVPGVIFHLLDGVDARELGRLGFGGLALAAIGLRYLAAPVHSATNDQFGAGALAAMRLRAAGCRRIGMILDTQVERRIDWRFAGGYFTHCAGELILPEIPPFTDIQNGRGVGAWIERHRIDGVLSVPYPFHNHLAAAGVRVPEDVAFAYLDVHADEPLFGGCAGVDQLHELVGAAAVDLVTAQIHRREKGVPDRQRVVLTEGRWRSGWSVREAGNASPRGKRGGRR